jgi:N-acyl-D-amino-acid deacylase
MRFAFLLVVPVGLFGPLTLFAQNYDVLIRNGHIVDGTGSPWYTADIAIRDGHIAAIGHLDAATAKQTIDAAGMTVAPGFIDMLGQSEQSILVNPHLPSKIYQGINMASYVGATQVRRRNRRWRPRPHSSRTRADEGARARCDARRRGWRIEFSAICARSYATTEELIALAAEGARFGGIYATHIRSEGDAIMPALDEAIRIGREAHVPVEIWHLKAAGLKNWGRMAEIVAHIDEARRSGVEIGANTYAYSAWYSPFSAFIPPWAHDGGDAKLIERLKDPATRARIPKDMETPTTTWDNEWREVPGPEGILIGVVQNPKLLPLQGKTIAEIAKLWKKDPLDTIFDLLIEDNAATEVAVFGMSEPEARLALQQPWVSVCNDSHGTAPDGLLGQEHPHPRAYGTFPRILRKYVREDGALTLPDAIRKFSALPAAHLRLTDRGVIKTGMWADIVVFNPDAITDLATFEKPNQLSEGMQYVLVNGVPVIDYGRMTNALPGKVVRGPAWKP